MSNPEINIFCLHADVSAVAKQTAKVKFAKFFHNKSKQSW